MTTTSISMSELLQWMESVRILSKEDLTKQMYSTSEWATLLSQQRSDPIKFILRTRYGQRLREVKLNLRVLYEET